MVWREKEINLLSEIYPYFQNSEIETIMENKSKSQIQYKSRDLDVTSEPSIKIAKSIEDAPELDVKSLDSDLCEFISGFIAGEGHFSAFKSARGDSRFGFRVELASNDAGFIQTLNDIFHSGNFTKFQREGNGYIVFYISSYGGLFNEVIPFFEKYPMYNSRKQNQFEEWKGEFLNNVPTRVVKERKKLKNKYEME